MLFQNFVRTHLAKIIMIVIFVVIKHLYYFCILHFKPDSELCVCKCFHLHLAGASIRGHLHSILLNLD